MPELMIFRPVIESQGVPFTILYEAQGSYIDGEWVHGTSSNVEATGIILPISNDILHYADAGTYTTKEKKLLTVAAIPEGTKVAYRDNQYTIEALKDFSEYTDVNIYVMRWRQ